MIGAGFKIVPEHGARELFMFLSGRYGRKLLIFNYFHLFFFFFYIFFFFLKRKAAD